MNLMQAQEGVEYTIKSLELDDEELVDFLFTLGCYSGEPVTIISKMRSGCLISIKNSRYNIDKRLASLIFV